QKYQLNLWFEAFSDRLYTDEGRLKPRKQPNAVHQSFDRIEQLVVELSEQGTLTTETGNHLAVHGDTICVLGDVSNYLVAVK
ncbi:LamB/YcsF family protein, partial [Neptunomonas phycophila]